MLRKLFLSLLCITSSISIVGIGYSAWYFVDNMKAVEATNTNIGVVLDDIQHLGRFNRVEFPSFVVLEEGQSPTDLYDGVSFFSIGENDERISDDNLNIEFSYDPSLASSTDINVSLRLKVSFAGNISNYIEFYPSSQSSDGWVDFSYFNDQYVINNNIHSLEVSLTDYFKYVSLDVKPNTKGKYTALYQNLSNGENKVIFEIEVYIVE